MHLAHSPPASQLLGHQELRATSSPGDFLPWEWKWSDRGPAGMRLGGGSKVATKAAAAGADDPSLATTR